MRQWGSAGLGIRLRYIFALFWGLLSFPCGAQQPADFTVSATEIQGYGLFEISSSARHTGFSRSAVAADAVRGVRFTNFTNEVPPVLKTNFGFQYTINSTPRGQRIPIRSVIHFPEPGLQRPDGKIYKQSVENKQIRLGRSELHGYGFDEPWEIVPGEWVFEVWHRDARLIRKVFVVADTAKTDASDGN